MRRGGRSGGKLPPPPPADDVSTCSPVHSSFGLRERGEELQLALLYPGSAFLSSDSARSPCCCSEEEKKIPRACCETFHLIHLLSTRPKNQWCRDETKPMGLYRSSAPFNYYSQLKLMAYKRNKETAQIVNFG